MVMQEDGGAVGKLWRLHGKGFYALIAVGTFPGSEPLAPADRQHVLL